MADRFTLQSGTGILVLQSGTGNLLLQSNVPPLALTGITRANAKLYSTSISLNYTATQSRPFTLLRGATLISLLIGASIRSSSRLEDATFVSVFQITSTRSNALLPGATLKSIFQITSTRSNALLPGATLKSIFQITAIRIFERLSSAILDIKFVINITPVSIVERLSSAVLISSLPIVGRTINHSRFPGGALVEPPIVLTGTVRVFAVLKGGTLSTVLTGTVLATTTLKSSTLITVKAVLVGNLRNSSRVQTLSLSLVYKSTPSRRTPRLRGVTVFFAGGITPITGRLRTVAKTTGRVSTVHAVGPIQTGLVRLYSAVLLFPLKQLITGTLRQVSRCYPVSITFNDALLAGRTVNSSRVLPVSVIHFLALFGTTESSGRLQSSPIPSLLLVTGQIKSTASNTATLHFTGTLGLSGFTFGTIVTQTAILSASFTGRCYAGFSSILSAVLMVPSLSIQALIGTIRSINAISLQALATFHPTISGVTRDSNGEPLAATTVYVFNMSTGNPVLEQSVVSDANGSYSVLVTAGINYWLTSYKTGTSDVAGATLKTIVGV